MSTHPLSGIAAALCTAFAIAGAPVRGEESQALSAAELAGKLSAMRQDGSTDVRARLEIAGGSFQIQIKSRRTNAGSDVYYRVLWPKERKDEAFVIRQRADGSANGAFWTAQSGVKSLAQSDLKLPFFGSDLTYEDLVDNFFGWSSQIVAGSETVDGTACVILESKPSGVRSSYSAVRSWIDTRRMVPLRVEKSIGGTLARRIDTLRVVLSDGRHIAASLRITRPGQQTATELDGSKIRRDVAFTDADFADEAVKPR